MTDRYKFKRYHYNYNGELTSVTEWGYLGAGFTSPAWNSGDDKDKCVDAQSTGLRDKAGTMIYEGDLLQVAGNVVYTVVYLTEDEHGETISAFGLGREGRTSFAIDHYAVIHGKIIGNLHEHPHLLNDRK